MVANGPPAESIEVGIIGFDGMTGLAIVMGGDRSPQETYIQLGGDGHRIPADVMRDNLEKSVSLRRICLNYPSMSS